MIASTSSSGSGSASAPTTTLYIDGTLSRTSTGQGTPLLSNHCGVAPAGGGTNPKACICRFAWNESNSTSGTSVTIRRTVETPVTIAQAALATCAAPDVYMNEIQDGTSIKITILPGVGNNSTFTTSTVTYLRSLIAATGSFRDVEGRAFENVRHYSCHEQFKRPTVIGSKIGVANNSRTGEFKKYPYANQFCVQQANGNAPSVECPTSSVPTNLEYSAQAYYYNFYVRANESGDVNPSNDRFSCPLVKEALNNPSRSVAGEGKLWPLDSTFALSLGRTNDFNIGIDAFVQLANGGNDPVSRDSKMCDGTANTAANGSTTGFVTGCLGFAARPNSDGTCPSFVAEGGYLRPTFRLRRYIAIYPSIFDADGKPPRDAQPSDTIYVLDRPVTGNSDPRKPYTMRGPKPCPFALFDKKGVTKTLPTDPLGYYATNDTKWNDKNVDNIFFPNSDGPNSCAAVFPLLQEDAQNPSNASISLGTSWADTAAAFNGVPTKLKKVYVRPAKSWSPHYIEDTGFEACAPQATPHKDPPLHFARAESGNIAWCSESYPSQNNHVQGLDKLGNSALPASAANKYTGKVIPYTSHAAKNSASATCTATIPPSILNASSYYPVYDPLFPLIPAAARHPGIVNADSRSVWNGPDPAVPTVIDSFLDTKTCDRTATNANPSGWQHFPLLAKADKVEDAIRKDSSYDCTITWDKGGSKKDKTTPTGGCCGPNVYMKTGTPTAVCAAASDLCNMNAHLEPDVPCLTPAY